MADRPRHEARTGQIWLQAGMPAIGTWSLIPLAFLIPLVDAAKAPYFDLTSTFSQVMYWMSRSGGRLGVLIVALSMMILLIIRRGITIQRRWKETCVLVSAAAICGGGGAALNEYLIKEQWKIPRPNIVWLAGENGSGPLGMTPEDFYEGANKQARRELLAKALNRAPRPVRLSSSIEAVWIKETGYSFPSGHAFTAMFFAVFLLMMAATYLTTKRLWLFYAFLPWALAVCYSRSILRIHTPTDITVGGLAGLVVGIAAWSAARMLIRRLAWPLAQARKTAAKP